MAEETALVTTQAQEILSAPTISRQQVELLKATVAKGTTDQELQLFLHVCRRTGLDPFAKQIYCRKRNSKHGPILSIETGIDGYRLIAERTQKYTGQIGPQWADDDLQWVDVWTKTKPPYVARVAALRSDFSEPMWAVAKWSEYCPSAPNDFMWRQMPAHMLGKVAEALALRRAFPQELSGLYGEEEMHVATIEAATVDRLTSRVVGFKGLLKASTSVTEIEQRWERAQAFRESVKAESPEAAEDLEAAYLQFRAGLNAPKVIAPKATVQEAEVVTTPTDLSTRVQKAVDAINSKNTESGVAGAWRACADLLDELERESEGGLIDELTAAKDDRLIELRRKS